MSNTESPAPLMHQPLRGLACVVGGTLLFAYCDAANKLLMNDYNAPLVSAVRHIGHLFLMTVLLGPIYGKRMVQTQRTGLVIIRAVTLVVGSFLVSLALARMPLAETVAIVYLCPVTVVLLSGPVLGEKVGLGAWVAAIVGFAGVLLIARPGSGLDPWGVFFVVCNVVVATAYNLLSRVLAHTERTMAMLFFSALVGSVAFGILLPWTMYGAAPTFLQIFLFASLCVGAWLGHHLYTQSFRYAPAALIAPMSYCHLIWSGVLGWVIFRDAPEPIALAGMVMVLAAGLISGIAPRRRRVTGAEATAPVSEPLT